MLDINIYITDPKCLLCSWPSPTSAHILNGCATALNQGRYSWRHDSVLKSITTAIQPTPGPSQKLYADLPGLRASNNPPATIPVNLSTSSDRPDLVIISGADVSIVELTISANNFENLRDAKSRKQAKYKQLIADLEAREDIRSVKYATLEIGSLGYHCPSTIRDLRSACNSLSKQDARILFDQGAKVAIACSYHIFQAHHSSEWDNNKLLYTL